MAKEDFLVTIGLEVHVQLKTRSKMFCGCAVRFGDEPNTLVCPVCLGLPGALPVLNKRAIEMTILTGQMLGCSTPPISKWDRKSYFYPDMPKNYQISQFDLPLCEGGGVPLYELAYPKDAQKTIAKPGKIVGLTRIHLEEDVAKSTHLAKVSTIDFNRAGTPLMEIVSEPEIESAEETAAYLNSLRQILSYGGVSDADMEKGQLRCDVNVSVRPKGQKELGTKIELKNMNSVSAVRRALHYEIDRQIEEVEAGNEIRQATWRWNEERGETAEMRIKEDAHDYRYLPDPDLLPVRTEEMVERIKKLVPELPHQKSARFVKDYGMTEYDAGVLSADPPLANYFESAAAGAKNGKKVANWVINNLLSALKEAELEVSECPVAAEKLGALLGLVDEGKLNGNQAKEVFAKLFEEPDKDPAEVAKDLGFEPADEGEIEGFVDQVIAKNSGLVEEIKGGNPKAINSLLGQVMKLSKGKANPQTVRGLLEKKILG
ncbi:MAG: aspartyl-tRNA(Asn)/glutamyl-tRNA(Gln) amidotransferase subunit B [Verrucomicrobiales bacterium]|jgi:aspartyl-tRNA(Asn)/glutamyl-tRNA(Gln) amidotransferase subunit B